MVYKSLFQKQNRMGLNARQANATFLGLTEKPRATPETENQWPFEFLIFVGAGVQEYELKLEFRP